MASVNRGVLLANEIYTSKKKIVKKMKMRMHQTVGNIFVYL